MRTSSRRFILGALLAGMAALPCVGRAQPAGGGGQPRPGTTLFALDLSRTPVGELPANIDLVNGILEVVLKNGMPMLKASALTEFRITLQPPGQVLPPDFTLEFDLIPKLGSAGQDLSVEGMPTINQGDASAHVLWHATGSLAVIGGGGTTYDTPMPEDFQASLPGVLTKVVLEVEGPTLRLYTNGRRLYTLQKQFARGGVLRVYLGAQNGGTEAVYLAGLRVTAGSGLGIAGLGGGRGGNAGSGSGGSGGGGSGGGTGSGSGSGGGVGLGVAGGPSTGGGGNSSIISGFTVTPGALWGATLQWTFAAGVATWLFEFSDGGGPFTAVSTGQAGNAQNSSQPGLTYTGMSQLLPGHHYQFRITGKAADGTVLGSAVQPFSTPAQWPQVANLSVTVGTLEQLAVPPDNQTLKPARKVTWTYDPLPGGVAALATFDRISTDPVTNQTTTIRAPAAPTRLASGSFTPVEAGTRLHLCVAAIVNPYLPGELIGESCLDADVPGATGQTGSSTGLGGGSLPGAGGNPTRLPNQLPNPTKPTPMLNDGTPPTVTLSSIPAGMMISYSSVQGATNYSVCRESPPGASCTQIGSAGVAVLGNLISQVDLGLAPGSSHAYRVTATRADGHYGESAPVSGVAGPLDPPKNLRVVSSTSTAATLAWDPVTYTDYTGSKPVTAYQLTGTGISAPVTVNGPQASVSLTSGTTNYQWKVAATLANLAGQVQVSPTPAVLDYTPSSRYRLVALGVKALQQSKDDLLDMDGRADEIYVAAVVNTTTRGATGSNIGNARSTTYGDIGNANAFPGRVQAGTAGPYGGIRTGDIVPISLDLAGPTPAPNTLGFPFLLWEGTLDDNAMVVVHPAVWEDDGNKAPYGGWVSRVTQHITSGWAAYWTVVSALRDQEILGPQDAPPSVTCWDPLSGNAANPSTCIHYGRDRPIGLRQITYNDHYDDRVLVLTRSAVEKALAGPSPRAGTPAGSIIVPLFESGTRVTAMYELYLRLERAP